MGALILRHNWTRQPQIPVEIDTSHPIGAKVAALLYLGSRYSVVGSPTFSFSKDGKLCNGSSASMIYTQYKPISNENLSILYCGSPSTTSGCGYCGVADTTGNHIFTLQYEVDGGSLRTRALIRAVNSGVALSKTAPPALNGVAGTYIATFAPTNDLRVYFNGIDVTLSGSFNNNISSFGQFSTLGLMGVYRPGGGNTYATTGRGYLSAVFGCTLSASEAFSVSQNPWQLIRPIQRRLWVVGEAAANDITGPCVITAEAAIGASGSKEASSPLAITATASMGMGGVKQASGPVVVTDSSSISAAGIKESIGPLNIVGTATIAAGGQKDIPGPAVITAETTFGMGGIKGAVGVMAIGADSALVAAGVKEAVGGAEFAALWSFMSAKGPDEVPITADEVARLVVASPRAKTVIASARRREVRYAIS